MKSGQLNNGRKKSRKEGGAGGREGGRKEILLGATWPGGYSDARDLDGSGKVVAAVSDNA